MELKHLQTSDSLEEITRIGITFLKQVENGPKSAALYRQTESLASELRGSIAGRKLSDIESVNQTRRLYHSLGIDPTKDRPSPERLLKRAMKGRPQPRVNKLVDAVNYVSLRLQCPLGAYDWDKIVPPVLVRMGRPDEGLYTPCNPNYGAMPDRLTESKNSLTRNWVKLHGRLILVDGEGLFGSPGHFSERAQVDQGTVRVMIVAWAPAGTPRSFLESVIEEVNQMCQEHCMAKVAGAGIL